MEEDNYGGMSRRKRTKRSASKSRARSASRKRPLPTLKVRRLSRQLAKELDGLMLRGIVNEPGYTDLHRQVGLQPMSIYKVTPGSLRYDYGQASMFQFNGNLRAVYSSKHRAYVKEGTEKVLYVLA